MEYFDRIYFGVFGTSYRIVIRLLLTFFTFIIVKIDKKEERKKKEIKEQERQVRNRFMLKAIFSLQFRLLRNVTPMEVEGTFNDKVGRWQIEINRTLCRFFKQRRVCSTDVKPHANIKFPVKGWESFL